MGASCVLYTAYQEGVSAQAEKEESQEGL